MGVRPRYIRVYFMLVIVGLTVAYIISVLSLAEFVSLPPQRNRIADELVLGSGAHQWASGARAGTGGEAYWPSSCPPRTAGTAPEAEKALATEAASAAAGSGPRCSFSGDGYIFVYIRAVDPTMHHGWGQWGKSLLHVLCMMGYPLNVSYTPPYVDETEEVTADRIRRDGDRVLAIFMQNYLEPESKLARLLGQEFWPRIFHGVFINIRPGIKALPPDSPLRGSHIMAETPQMKDQCEREQRELGLGAVCANLPLGTDTDNILVPSDRYTATREGVPVVLIKYVKGYEPQGGLNETLLFEGLHRAGVYSYVVLRTRHGGPERFSQWSFHRALLQAPWILFFLPINMDGISQAIQEVRAFDVPMFLIPHTNRLDVFMNVSFTPQDGVIHVYKSPWPELPDLIQSFVSALLSFRPREAVEAQLSHRATSARLHHYMLAHVSHVRSAPLPVCKISDIGGAISLPKSSYSSAETGTV